MSEANARSGPSPAETLGGHAAEAHDEHLPTTRLPPISSPPVSRSGRPGSPLAPPSPPASFGTAFEREPPSSQPRSSPLAPSAIGLADRGTRDELQQLRRLIGVACAGLGLALGVAGLAVGLIVGIWGGLSAESLPAPAVAVALVVTRGTIVLGMLAFGCGLLFFGTRLLLGRALQG
ncbi:MAG: hypothetical protein WBY94_15920 [Polyangiaceae bacterium]